MEKSVSSLRASLGSVHVLDLSAAVKARAEIEKAIRMFFMFVFFRFREIPNDGRLLIREFMPISKGVSLFDF